MARGLFTLAVCFNSTLVLFVSLGALVYPDPRNHSISACFTHTEMAGPCCCDTLFHLESRVIRIRMAQELEPIDQIIHESRRRGGSRFCWPWEGASIAISHSTF